MIWLTFCALLLGGGENPRDAFKSDHVTIVVLVDGTRADSVQKLLDEGKLPNIAKLLPQSVVIKNAVTGFPSMTMAAHAAATMGRLPGSTKVSNLRTFDPQLNKSVNFMNPLVAFRVGHHTGPNGASAAHMLKNKNVVAVYEPMVPGASHSVVPLPLGRMFYLPLQMMLQPLGRHYEGVNAKVLDPLRMAALTAQSHYETLVGRAVLRSTRPDVMYFWLIEPDSVGHDVVRGREAYEQSIRTADGQIGRLVRDAHANYKDVTVAIISDHGTTETVERIPVQERLKGLGFKLGSRFAGSKNAVVVANNGNASLYFKNAKKQTGFFFEELERFELNGKSVNLVKELSSLKGVQFFVARDAAGAVQIVGPEGRSQIEINAEDHVRYRVLSGRDPLEYATDARAARLLDGRFHSPEEVLAATHASKYPDAAYQLGHYMKRQAGLDAMLVTADGFSFSTTATWFNRSMSHGKLGRGDMMVPLIVYSTRLKPKVVEYGRLGDVFPAILRLNGMTPAEIEARKLDFPLREDVFEVRDLPPSKPVTMKARLAGEGASAGLFVGGSAVLAGAKSAVQGNAQELRGFVDSVQTPQFWGSLASFSIANKVGTHFLMRGANPSTQPRFMRTAKGMGLSAVPLYGGMLAGGAAAGHFSPEDALIETASFMPVMVPHSAGMNIVRGAVYPALKTRGPLGLAAMGTIELSAMAGTLYGAEQIRPHVAGTYNGAKNLVRGGP